MSGGGERTEAATPRKLQNLRSEGRVVRSTDLAGAAGLLVGLLVLQASGGDLAGQLGASIEQHLRELPQMAPTGARADLSDAGLADVGRGALWLFVGVMAPLLAALPLAGVLANVGQVGFLLNGKGLKLDFNHVNPLSGFKRLFSVRSGVELLKTLVKVGILGFLLYRTYVDSLPALLSMAGADLRAAIPQLVGMAFNLSMTVGVAFLALAVLDYGYQRWQFQRDARMSKEEIKQEYKQSEGSPEIKGAIRRRQRKMAQARMMQNVPKADVVITNPTHFAAALAYRGGEMGAPKVVAKGADLVAQRIKQIARESGVAVVENKPLARALYATVEVDREIPAELFQAVAEVLAYIYGLRRRRRAALIAAR